MQTFKLDFKKLYNEKKMKFNNNFRIMAIKEFVQVQYGDNFENQSKIGRVYGINNNNGDVSYVLYDGEFILNTENGKEELDGFGRYISDYYYKEGMF